MLFEYKHKSRSPDERYRMLMRRGNVAELDLLELRGEVIKSAIEKYMGSKNLSSYVFEEDTADTQGVRRSELGFNMPWFDGCRLEYLFSIAEENYTFASVVLTDRPKGYQMLFGFWNLTNPHPEEEGNWEYQAVKFHEIEDVMAGLSCLYQSAVDNPLCDGTAIEEIPKKPFSLGQIVNSVIGYLGMGN